MGGAILVALAGIAGAGWGYASDRIAARWPAHEDGSVRPRDWRTWLVVLAGAVSGGATLARFGTDLPALAIVGVYVVALVLLFATDLDQRLLPDVVTLPLIGLAGLAYVTGAGPFVRTTDELLWAAGAAVLIPAGLFVLAIPFGAGAIGQGDLKLLLSVGLLAGALKLFYALAIGALLAGVIVAILVFIRRLTLKSYVPYGPFLIVGTLWVILALPAR
jgi:leader peptidase (prepilin peptidase)/N-methyltransferase